METPDAFQLPKMSLIQKYSFPSVFAQINSWNVVKKSDEWIACAESDFGETMSKLTHLRGKLSEHRFSLSLKPPTVDEDEELNNIKAVSKYLKLQGRQLKKTKKIFSSTATQCLQIVIILKREVEMLARRMSMASYNDEVIPGAEDIILAVNANIHAIDTAITNVENALYNQANKVGRYKPSDISCKDLMLSEAKDLVDIIVDAIPLIEYLISIAFSTKDVFTKCVATRTSEVTDIAVKHILASITNVNHLESNTCQEIATYILDNYTIGYNKFTRDISVMRDVLPTSLPESDMVFLKFKAVRVGA